MQAVSVLRDKAGRRLDISVSENIYGGMTKPELALAQETENLLAQQDLTMEQTKEKKNALESYVYEMRNKVKIDISKIHIVIIPRYKEITKFWLNLLYCVVKLIWFSYALKDCSTVVMHLELSTSIMVWYWNIWCI